MKGPYRFDGEKEVRMLLEEAKALGRTEKAGLKSKKTKGKNGVKEVPFKLCLWDSNGQEKGLRAWQLPAGDPEGI